METDLQSLVLSSNFSSPKVERAQTVPLAASEFEIGRSRFSTGSRVMSIGRYESSVQALGDACREQKKGNDAIR